MVKTPAARAADAAAQLAAQACGEQMDRISGLAATLERLNRQAWPETAPVRMRQTVSFGPNPGDLRMLTYRPDTAGPGSALVVVLHGCGQRAEAHAVSAGWLTLAERHGFVVLAAEQASENNPNCCFNWFQPEDSRRGAGEPASIRSMVDHCVREYALDDRRVFVTGLSAGGAMAVAMLAAYPEAFAAGATVAGLPFGVATDVSQAVSLMHAPQPLSAGMLGDLVRKAAPALSRPRLIIWHGDADTTVNWKNADATARQWASAHGLAEHPDERDSGPDRTTSLWRDPGGEVVVELNLIHGLGHATPLCVRGDDGLGSVGPYMADVGISSSLETARFWGLAPQRG